MKKIAILGIDLQNDFVLPTGALSVVGAMEDVKRIGEFINKNSSKINHISLTLDSHHPIHIAHASYWKDKDGNHPSPFTQITSSDAKAGKWTPQFNPQWSFKYLEELEKEGGVNVIWNEHCLLGTNGWAIVDEVMNAVTQWERDNSRFYNLWFKGSNIFTEHFSIFKANVPYPNAPETQLNQQLIQVLNEHDEVFICGEALNYCVLNSVKDLNTYAPDLMKKVTILSDCSSAIGTFDINTDSVYQESVRLGAKIMKSTDVVL